MKKLLTLIALMLIALTASAQVVTGKDVFIFEDAYNFNKEGYAEKVDLMSKITLRAIEIIDGLDDLKDIREE